MIKSDSDLEKTLGALKEQVDMVRILTRRNSLISLASVEMLKTVYEGLSDAEGYMVMRRMGGRTGAENF